MNYYLKTYFKVFTIAMIHLPYLRIKKSEYFFTKTPRKLSRVMEFSIRDHLFYGIHKLILKTNGYEKRKFKKQKT